MPRPIRLGSVDELAAALGVPKYVVTRCAFQADRSYKLFTIPKRGTGQPRRISAPSPVLRGVQRWILFNILRDRPLHDSATAFAPQSSILKNAAPHVGADFVVNLDIKDFFPSISARRVFGLFRSFGYPKEVCFILTRLCTMNDALPQGAPTSPDIANLVCRHLDVRLASLCKVRDWNYTRYADDITISGSGSSERVISLATTILNDEGFDVSTRKSRTLRRGDCQMVTGLVVNERVALPRKWRRRLRAMIHQISIGNTEAKQQLSRVHGMVSFLTMVDPNHSLVRRFEAISD